MSPHGRFSKRSMPSRQAIFLFCFALACAGAQAAGQDHPAAAPKADRADAKAIHEKREEIAAKMAALSSSEDSSPAGVTAEHGDETLQGLRALDALYAGREKWLEEKQRLEQQVAAETKELEAL